MGHIDQNEAIEVLLVRLYRAYVFIPNRGAEEQLGLLYVGTAAKQAGYSVEVCDDPNLTVSSLCRLVRSLGAKVIGFYTDHDNVFSVMSAIADLKDSNPELLCVTGGPQAREWDKRILQDSPCDIVVRGEGEVTFVECLDFFLKGKGRLSDIKGISYVLDGAYKKNPDSPPVDLDLIPIPDRTLNPARTRPSGVENIVSGRGCPFRCTFCYEGRPEAQYRPRDLNNVIEEIEHLVIDRKARYISILDDVFTLNPKRVFAFVDALRKLREREKVEFNWFCEARADIICKKPEMVKACVDVGLVRMQVGVETGNQGVLDAYNKKLNVNETAEAVRICNEASVLSVVGNFIIGGAHETKETLQDSIDFAKRLLDLAPGRMEITTTIFTPYPGTPMHQHPERFGLKILDEDCLTGPGDHYPFASTIGLTKWEVLDARERFVEAVNGHMKKIAQDLPTDLVEKHFFAYVNNNMRTRWFDYFCKSWNCYNYFGLLAWSQDFQRMGSVPFDELGLWRPLRTCFLASSCDGKFIVNAGHKRMELSERAGAVLELCGGRLPLHRFSTKLQESGLNVPDADILALLAQFDSDQLVVFTKT